MEEKVNYAQLMAYIEQTHPTQEIVGVVKSNDPNKPPEPTYESFSIFAKLGTLSPSLPCCKTSEPTPMA